jgi:hypothetical protein
MINEKASIQYGPEIYKEHYLKFYCRKWLREALFCKYQLTQFIL